MAEHVTIDAATGARIARAVQSIEALTGGPPSRRGRHPGADPWSLTKIVQITGEGRDASADDLKTVYPGLCRHLDPETLEPIDEVDVWVVDFNDGELVNGHHYHARQNQYLTQDDELRPLYVTDKEGTGYGSGSGSGSGSQAPRKGKYCVPFDEFKCENGQVVAVRKALQSDFPIWITDGGCEEVGGDNPVAGMVAASAFTPRDLMPEELVLEPGGFSSEPGAQGFNNEFTLHVQEGESWNQDQVAASVAAGWASPEGAYQWAFYYDSGYFWLDGFYGASGRVLKVRYRIEALNFSEFGINALERVAASVARAPERIALVPGVIAAALPGGVGPAAMGQELGLDPGIFGGTGGGIGEGEDG